MKQRLPKAKLAAPHLSPAIDLATTTTAKTSQEILPAQEQLPEIKEAKTLPSSSETKVENAPILPIESPLPTNTTLESANETEKAPVETKDEASTSVESLEIEQEAPTEPLEEEPTRMIREEVLQEEVSWFEGQEPLVQETTETESLSNYEVTEEEVAERTLPPPLPKVSPLLIQTHGLVKQYGGRRVVNGVDISVRAGEVVGLLGKNGAGKTTTFYMIVGLVPPTYGQVYMGDEDVTTMPMYRRARRGIGYLPQEESIFRKLTVEENLLAILETLPISEAEREQRCDELLKDFGLEHVRNSIAITLSGGEKRRVTIARALVTSPSLLLLDEPFSGVDPMAVHDIQEIILHLRERGLGVLITDHNVRETLSVVDRAYIINEGRVLSEGTSDFLINDPVARQMYLGERFSM